MHSGELVVIQHEILHVPCSEELLPESRGMEVEGRRRFSLAFGEQGSVFVLDNLIPVWQVSHSSHERNPGIAG